MSKSEQTELFPELVQKRCKPVNVASVPFRSPFRYPGGKTWFVPAFREWIRYLDRKSDLLIEPFAGGGIISLTAIFERLVDNVLMVELDEDIAAVWQVVCEGGADKLAKRIITFDLNVTNLKRELSKKPKSLLDMAFQTILKNRTYHGGILAEGSGLMKSGENGKGITSRWYPKTLSRRIRNIGSLKEKIDFIRKDGLHVMERYSQKDDVVFFIDPPYTAGGKKAGKRLYKYNEIDHERLFDICSDLSGDFLMTYDISDEAKSMAMSHNFDMRSIPMKNTHNNKMYELVIAKDLSWMD